MFPTPLTYIRLHPLGLVLKIPSSFLAFKASFLHSFIRHSFTHVNAH